MEAEIVLKANGGLTLREQNPLGELSECALLTAREAQKDLKCSQRQLYRYVAEKRVKPVGKFLGQLIFKAADIGFFHRPRRGLGAKLPDFLKPVFWSNKLRDVDPSAHARHVVGQILEHGDMQAIKWAYGYYGLDYILRVASVYRELSPQTRNFWLLYGRRHAS